MHVPDRPDIDTSLLQPLSNAFLPLHCPATPVHYTTTTVPSPPPCCYFEFSSTAARLKLALGAGQAGLSTLTFSMGLASCDAALALTAAFCHHGVTKVSLHGDPHAAICACSLISTSVAHMVFKTPPPPCTSHLAFDNQAPSFQLSLCLCAFVHLSISTATAYLRSASPVFPVEQRNTERLYSLHSTLLGLGTARLAC